MPTHPPMARPTPHFRVVPGRDPGTHPTAGAGRAMGHRARPGDDAGPVEPAHTQTVVSAKAGPSSRRHPDSLGIPASAGMTDKGRA